MTFQNKYTALLNELKNRTSENSMHPNSRVLVVDGMNTFIRAYAASPVVDDNGRHVGGISGTLMSIGHAIKAINPTRVVVVFDGKNGSAKRRQMFSDYKSNRKVKIRLNRAETVDQEDNQLEQLMRLIEYFEVLPFKTLVYDGTEADDVIAYIAKDYYTKEDSQVYIMSSDKDFYQLVDSKTFVWSPTKKKLYFQEDVYEEFGIMPQNFPIYRALLGDKSDNINGVDGVGDKTIKSKFSILTEKRIVELAEFIDFAQSKVSEAKIYEKLLTQQDILKRNLELMQLAESNLNLTIKMRIIETLDGQINKTAKLAFHRMLIEDRMTTAIKNVDIWLKEITSKLDMFALQT